MDLDNNKATFLNDKEEEITVNGDVFLATDGAFSAVRDAMIRNPSI